VADVTGGKMRDYQIRGLNWMVELHANGVNGILVGCRYPLPPRLSRLARGGGFFFSPDITSPSNLFLCARLTKWDLARRCKLSPCWGT
jgi:hypothetical protein